jgi:transposase
LGGDCENGTAEIGDLGEISERRERAQNRKRKRKRNRKRRRERKRKKTREGREFLADLEVRASWGAACCAPTTD